MGTPLHFVFRADASVAIATGHVMRCRNLARELRRRGSFVQFICAELPGNLIPLLKSEGFGVSVIPATEDESIDAASCIDVLRDTSADYVIVDHYALSARWESALRAHARKIVALDDLADRPHAADILLDQNFSLSSETRYADLLPASSRRLLGPRFALLTDDYLPWRRPADRARSRVDRILVYFGGSDLADMTGATLAALSAPEFADVAIDIVVGGAYQSKAALERAIARRPRTALHAPQTSLADLIASADLAIGAGGATTWERLCLGVPTILISTAANQYPSSRDQAQAGLAVYLGAAEQFQADALRQITRALIDDGGLRERIVHAGQSHVDGLGTRRVAEVLNPTATNSLELRPARRADAAFLFDLANDAEVRRQSFNSAPIAWPEHAAWFDAKLSSPDVRLFLLEADDLPVGQIRFDLTPTSAVLSYALDPLVRGRGWGGRLVDLGLRQIAARDVKRITAEVRPSNPASCLIFERRGFTSAPGHDPSKRVYTRDLN